jgi:hypothetical protein
MNRVYDKTEAIRDVQTFLRVVGDPNIFVAPSGVFDDNTRLSVIEFQSRFSLEPTGVVDYESFNLLYREYVLATSNEQTREITDSFIDFPLSPGDFKKEMTHINRTLARLLDYYGHTHRLRSNNFYSNETSLAVKILRSVYMLGEDDYIDEEFYRRMIIDHDSIAENIFS